MKYNWEKLTEQQKIKAAQTEVWHVTHNGTTKDDLINILRWLWDKFEIVNQADKGKIFISCTEKQKENIINLLSNGCLFDGPFYEQCGEAASCYNCIEDSIVWEILESGGDLD